MESGALRSRLSAFGPRLIDGMVALGLAAALELQLAHGDYEGDATLNIAGAALLTLPLWWRRRAPVAVIVVFGATAILNEGLGGTLFTFPEAGAPAGTDDLPPLFAALAAGILAFYSLGAHADDRRALVGGLIGLGALWITVVVSDQADVASFLWSGGIVAAAPWLAGRANRARVLRIEALEREQEQRTRLAVSDERSRLARELHDIVAHSVGVIVVQAEGARRVFDRDPQRAREALDSIEATARSALGEMRRSLRLLRAEDGEAELEPQPGLPELESLLERVRAGGLEVELVVEGEQRDLPQGIDLSVYRIIQEALTNSIKHAGGSRARVTLSFGERELAVEIADNGRGPEANGFAPTGGHGLVGMRERVVSHGGELQTGAAAGGGFLVRAKLPLTR